MNRVPTIPRFVRGDTVYWLSVDCAPPTDLPRLRKSELRSCGLRISTGLVVPRTRVLYPRDSFRTLSPCSWHIHTAFDSRVQSSSRAVDADADADNHLLSRCAPFSTPSLPPPSLTLSTRSLYSFHFRSALGQPQPRNWLALSHRTKYTAR